MEDKMLNEKESLELISQMIQNTRKRMVERAGTPFLIWGYVTVAIALVIWGLITATGQDEWLFLWLLLPVIGAPATYLVKRKYKPQAKTYVDRVVTSVWIVFGWVAVVVSVLSFWRMLPVLFLILLLMGMGTALTGMVIRFKALVAGGVLGILLSFGCLWMQGIDQILFFAAAFVFMMIVPGHILNRATGRAAN